MDGRGRRQRRNGRNNKQIVARRKEGDAPRRDERNDGGRSAGGAGGNDDDRRCSSDQRSTVRAYARSSCRVRSGCRRSDRERERERAPLRWMDGWMDASCAGSGRALNAICFARRPASAPASCRARRRPRGRLALATRLPLPLPRLPVPARGRPPSHVSSLARSLAQPAGAQLLDQLSASWPTARRQTSLLPPLVTSSNQRSFWAVGWVRRGCRLPAPPSSLLQSCLARLLPATALPASAGPWRRLLPRTLVRRFPRRLCVRRLATTGHASVTSDHWPPTTWLATRGWTGHRMSRQALTNVRAIGQGDRRINHEFTCALHTALETVVGESF